MSGLKTGFRCDKVLLNLSRAVDLYNKQKNWVSQKAENA